MNKRFFIETYGCEMNKSDSLDIALALQDAGYVRVEDPESADVVVLNTCSVRQNAADRLKGRLGHYRAVKNGRKAGPEPGRDLVLVLAGCLAQEQGEELSRSFPEIDIVTGTFNRLRIPEALDRYFSSGQHTVLNETGGYRFAGFGGRRAEGFRAWVPIISGCSNFCTYCIVPYVRGPETSRSSSEVLDEVKKLAGQGVVEITLLGQNVNAYGKDSGDVSFVGLLEKLNRVEGIRWIRYLTSHPRDFAPESAARLASLDNVCQHVHLPLQSGSDRILQLMNRGYTMSHYRSVAEAVRCCMPDASLTTDLIVGFPSETEQDFEATLNAVREFRFDDAFTYRYSPRAPAKAGPVTDSEHQAAGERLSTLIDLQREISGEQNSKEIGRGCEVLIERQSKQSETEMLCRTEQNRMVVVPTAGRPGSFIQVRITGTAGRTLLGVEA